MLSQTGIYAIRATSYLASERDEKPILGRIIAEEMQIPVNFLSKILNRLVQAGFIRPVRGRKGGFVMAMPAMEKMLEEVTIDKVM